MVLQMKLNPSVHMVRKELEAILVHLEELESREMGGGVGQKGERGIVGVQGEK